MKGSRGCIPMSGFSLLACGIVVASCLRLAGAADGPPNTNLKDRTEAQTHRSAPARRKSPRSAPMTAARVAATPTSHGRSRSHLAAAPIAREDDVIASLQERLDRQEKLLALQQNQIAKLTATVDELKNSLNGRWEAPPESAPERLGPQVAAPHAELAAVRTAGAAANPPAEAAAGGKALHPNLLVSLQPSVSHFALASAAAAVPTTTSSLSPASSQSTQDQTQSYATRLETLSKQVEGISRGIAGFRFSGDLRLRADGIFRSANSVASAQQNVRGRYRLRLNLDKGIDQQLDVHFQLGSGRFDNPLTDDSDFAGGAVRGPVFLSEAWVDYHPNPTLSFRGGKMPEVFQDHSRFIWDEDVRFNGFQESISRPMEDNPLGITRIDLRAGQYILTNPNIQALPSAEQCTPASQTITSLPATITPPTSVPAACAYLQAGYSPGERVRAANLFDQGFFVKGRIKPGWSHNLFSNFMLYRNPNQIALTSLSSGPAVLVNGVAGITLAGPLPGTGSATTIPGGGIFTAGHFQIGRLAYRITKEGWRFRNEAFPVFIDIQASRNFGASFLRNAWMATLNAGEVKKAGDIRFLYLYAVKDANSMVSQFTDDHVGTLSGVNIRTHVISFDLGLAKSLQWQNSFYIQNEISHSDPARHFYVPVPAGTPTQYRMESSLFVNF
jgi:hypothetical protein